MSISISWVQHGEKYLTRGHRFGPSATLFGYGADITFGLWHWPFSSYVTVMNNGSSDKHQQAKQSDLIQTSPTNKVRT